MERRTAILGAAVLVVVALAGCAGPSAITSSTGRIIAVATQHSSAAEQALAEGTVGWGLAGCMIIARGQENLVVFPHGTSLDGDTVTLPDGTKIEAGDDVALGGGFHSPDDAAESLPDVPEECLTDEIFWASGEIVG